MRQNGCSGCTNPQIFGTSPFAPPDFEASSTMCTRCFETQSSSGCTCTHRSKILLHSLKNLGRFYKVPFKSLLRVQIKWGDCLIGTRKFQFFSNRSTEFSVSLQLYQFYLILKIRLGNSKIATEIIRQKSVRQKFATRYGLLHHSPESNKKQLGQVYKSSCLRVTAVGTKGQG